MTQAKTSTELLKPSDIRLTRVGIALAVICLVPISIPGLYGPLNAVVMHAISWQLGILMLISAGAMYYGILVNQGVRYNDHLKEQQAQVERDALGHFSCHVFYRDEGEGTVWDIVNVSRFPWTNASVIIEREIDGRKTFEKHVLGRVGIRKSLLVQSRLSPSPTAFWRVMVSSDQGRKIDFPEEGIPLEGLR